MESITISEQVSKIGTYICDYCGNEFRRYSCIVHHERHYCNQTCYRADKPNLTIRRFWKFVQKGEGCWEWQGVKRENKPLLNYGRFNIKTHKLVDAHRFSYELHNGPIPKGMIVLHECDNPPCVNPAHLRLGTPADNVADMIAKGRAWHCNGKGRRTRQSSK